MALIKIDGLPNLISINSMVIFHGYVKWPDGNTIFYPLQRRLSMTFHLLQSAFALLGSPEGLREPQCTQIIWQLWICAWWLAPCNIGVGLSVQIWSFTIWSFTICVATQNRHEHQRTIPPETDTDWCWAEQSSIFTFQFCKFMLGESNAVTYQS